MTDTPRKKIVVGTNSLTDCQYPAYTNHCQMWFRFGRSYPDIDFLFVNPSRMSIDRMRGMTAKVALENEADAVLFVDDDVLVPMDGLKRLLDCDADVAGGKAVIRGYPFDWMVFSDTPDKKGLVTHKELPRTGVIDVAAMGFCFTLIKTSVFKKMQPPFFVTGATWTEDIYFCMKARDANPGLKVKVDCGLELGHILWPEIMDGSNRAQYKTYYEEMNPSMLQKPDEGDRGNDYRKQVLEATGRE